MYKLFWKSCYAAVKLSRQNCPGLNWECSYILTVRLHQLTALHPPTQLRGLCPLLPARGFYPGSKCLPAPPGVQDYCKSSTAQPKLPAFFTQAPLELIWQLFHFGSWPAQDSAQQAWKTSYMKCTAPSDQLSFILTSFLSSYACMLFPLNLLLTKYLFALYPSGQQFS